MEKRTARRTKKEYVSLKYQYGINDMLGKVGETITHGYILNKCREHAMSNNIINMLLGAGIITRIRFGVYKVARTHISLVDIAEMRDKYKIHASKKKKPITDDAEITEVLFEDELNTYPSQPTFKRPTGQQTEIIINTIGPVVKEAFTLPQPGSKEEWRMIIKILREDVNDIMNTLDRSEQIFRMVGEIKVHYLKTEDAYQKVMAYLKENRITLEQLEEKVRGGYNIESRFKEQQTRINDLEKAYGNQNIVIDCIQHDIIELKKGIPVYGISRESKPKRHKNITALLMALAASRTVIRSNLKAILFVIAALSLGLIIGHIT